MGSSTNGEGKRRARIGCMGQRDVKFDFVSVVVFWNTRKGTASNAQSGKRKLVAS